MATMTKRSSISDSMRSGGEFASAGESGRAVASAVESWFTASNQCQREMMDFVTERIEKDAETAREMLNCKSLADMTTIQSRWMEETIKDYRSEMVKLMSLYSETASRGSLSRG
jgi:hypothetical protein